MFLLKETTPTAGDEEGRHVAEAPLPCAHLMCPIAACQSSNLRHPKEYW